MKSSPNVSPVSDVNVFQPVVNAVDGEISSLNSLVDMSYEGVNQAAAANFDAIQGLLGESYEVVNSMAANNFDAINSLTIAAYGATQAEIEQALYDAVGATHSLIDTVQNSVDDEFFSGEVQEKSIWREIKDEIERTLDSARDSVGTALFNLGIGFDLAMAAITFIPDLLLTWKEELTGWLTFDVAEFQDTIKKMHDISELEGEE